ncbi:MAG TPA: hypothetical protein VN926_13475 [Bradyrhizobium sp.]|nr:hypothetical protein [Bradyrhizobium sp.]
MSQPGHGLALANRNSGRGDGAEVMPARGIGGSASGLIGSHNDRRQLRTEQRPRQPQRLKLRVGARRGKDHIDLRWRQAETSLQFLAHRLGARFEGFIEADGDGRPHQRLPCGARAIVGLL